jgi:hypothetical protein
MVPFALSADRWRDPWRKRDDAGELNVVDGADDT